MKVIKKSWFPSGSLGIGPFILAREGERLDDWTVNYWTIIWKQQLETLIFGWFIWLLVETLLKLERQSDISFFQEAKNYQSNLAYPRFRPIWAWIKYINN